MKWLFDASSVYILVKTTRSVATSSTLVMMLYSAVVSARGAVLCFENRSISSPSLEITLPLRPLGPLLSPRSSAAMNRRPTEQEILES